MSKISHTNTELVDKRSRWISSGFQMFSDLGYSATYSKDLLAEQFELSVSMVEKILRNAKNQKQS